MLSSDVHMSHVSLALVNSVGEQGEGGFVPQVRTQAWGGGSGPDQDLLRCVSFVKNDALVLNVSGSPLTGECRERVGTPYSTTSSKRLSMTRVYTTNISFTITTQVVMDTYHLSTKASIALFMALPIKPLNLSIVTSTN